MCSTFIDIVHLTCCWKDSQAGRELALSCPTSTPSFLGIFRYFLLGFGAIFLPLNWAPVFQLWDNFLSSLRNLPFTLPTLILHFSGLSRRGARVLRCLRRWRSVWRRSRTVGRRRRWATSSAPRRGSSWTSTRRSSGRPRTICGHRPCRDLHFVDNLVK